MYISYSYNQPFTGRLPWLCVTIISHDVSYMDCLLPSCFVQSHTIRSASLFNISVSSSLEHDEILENIRALKNRNDARETFSSSIVAGAALEPDKLNIPNGGFLNGNINDKSNIEYINETNASTYTQRVYHTG